MEARKTKKHRLHGDSPKGSHGPCTSLSPPPGPRPQQKERVKSAPLVPQVRSSLRPSARRGSQALERGPHLPPPPLSPNVPQTTASSKRSCASNSVECRDEVQEVGIAVLGAAAAGKSTFVQCALDLKRAVTSPVSSKRVSLEGSISIVRLIELDVEDVAITNQSVRWPAQVGPGHLTPPIDGVLVMYNVMDKNSLESILSVLHALVKNDIPTVLVASGCENPSKSWQIDHDMSEDMCTKLNCVESFHTSTAIPETHKRCISVMLRNVMLKMHGESCKPKLTLRTRAVTTSSPTSPLESLHSARAERNHRRAASEILNSVSQTPVPAVRGAPTQSEDSLVKTSFSPGEEPDMTGDRRASFEQCCSSKGSDEEQELDDASWEYHGAANKMSRIKTSVRSTQAMADAMAESSPLDEEGETTNSVPKLDTAPWSSTSTSNLDDDDGKGSGASFDELVDRLLSQPMSRTDSKFAAIFLCLYRKFAPPSTLLLAIIQRFEDLNDQNLPNLSRLSSQLRYLSIVREWVFDYPGDFAHHLTRRMVTSFVNRLATSQAFAVAHKEISPLLDIVSEDDDTEWACSDNSRSRASTMESFLTLSSVQTVVSTITTDSSSEDIVDQVNPTKEPQTRSARNSSTPSTTSSAGMSASQSTYSFQTLLNSIENAQRQAQLLTPVPRNSFDKIRWHQMMETSDEHIARELTRIDWVLYSSIRPRDLVRHVSLPVDQKEKCKSLEHVSRMIDQFNHVAFWVANMILLRDKPKHRSRALEKFMGVAWQLRYLNNYNSLGAVVAGINGTAVHRLAQTRELVSPEAQKQFMRLEILMGTQKSHFAYRLAWANTSTSRIPFLPLHRRDLISAEEGNRTLMSSEDCERINWRKFEIMGEVIIGIRKSQELPYPTIRRNELIRQLVLDARFSKDDDELYERSIQLENPGVGEGARKKFNWFQR